MKKNKKNPKKQYVFSGAGQRERLSQKAIGEIIDQSVKLYRQGKVREALKTTKQALKQFPDHLPLLSNASMLAATIGDIQTAEKYFRIILKINPS